MKKILLVILFCTAASLNCYNGSENNGNGHTGGKDWAPYQKAALLHITSDKNKLFDKDPQTTFAEPNVASPFGFGFFNSND